MMTAESPSLPRASGLRLAGLLLLVALFYLLLVGCLAVTIYALVRLILWTPIYLATHHSLGALKLLLILYTAGGIFGFAVIRGLLARTGGGAPGLPLDRATYPLPFTLVEEVARTVGADPIHAILLSPGDEVGVWEETALWQPPGAGKRLIVLGMAALSTLTLDEFRAVLAHEYAHFSHRDTFFGRFIYRVGLSTDVLSAELLCHGGRIQYLNPLYWAVRLFATLYARLAAAFSRLREVHADRRAAQGYGRATVARALIALSLEGSFFAEVGGGGTAHLVSQGTALPNLYHFTAAARRAVDRTHPGAADAALALLLTTPTGRLDHHPSLNERLAALGAPASDRHLSPRPRAVPVPALATLAGADATALQEGEPSAAEALFGADAAELQEALSRIYALLHAILMRG